MCQSTTIRPGRTRWRTRAALLMTTAAYGCPGCPCSPVSCESGACHCRCCCIDNYPLPAVVGTAAIQTGDGQ